MINKTKTGVLLTINIISSTVNVATLSISFFIIYKLIIFYIGIESLGIWSLILATTSFANISNLGISNSLIKIIANNSAENKTTNVDIYIQTAYTSIFLAIGIFIIIIYNLSPLFFDILISKKYLNDALKLLPYSLLCFWINGITAIFISAIEGYQLIYKKNIISILSSFLLMGFVFILIDKGLIGVAIAQLIQSAFMLISSIFVLKSKTRNLLFLKIRWSKNAFLEMLKYGSQIQLIAILNLFWDPLNKFSFAAFGSLSTLASYEMSSRLVTQVRSIVVLSNQSIIPYIASNPNREKLEIINIYKKNIYIILALGPFLMSSIIAFSPYISQMWIGYFDLFFCVSLVFLSIAWCINISSSPSYFINLATGHLKYNIINHLIYSILNPVLNVALGSIFHSYGLLFANSLSIAIGSIYLVYAFWKYYDINISTSKVFTTIFKHIILITICIITIWLVYYSIKNSFHSLCISLFIFSIYTYTMLRISLKTKIFF